MEAPDNISKWSTLLVEWKNELIGLSKRHSEQWSALGLPNAETINFIKPIENEIKIAQEKWPFLDKEVLAFYQVSNGWPLWLGSFFCEVMPIEKIGLFKDMYAEGFQIAKSHAPQNRITNGQEITLSISDFDSAIVLTSPDAREFILSLKSGEACFYQFDGMLLFNDFYEYMKYSKLKLMESISEMLDF